MSKTKKNIISVLLCFAAFFFISAFAVTAKTEAAADDTDLITIVPGASIRLDKAYDKANVETGIRFFADVSKELSEKLLDGNDLKENCEIGMFVVPSSYIDDFENQNTTDDYWTYFETEKDLSKGEISVQFDGDELSVTENSRVQCSLYRLLDENFNTEYRAVAYYTEDGANYFYSAPGDPVSVAETANKALSDTEYEYTAEQRKALANIMEKSILLQNGRADYSATLVVGGSGIDLKSRYANNIGAENVSITVTGGKENVSLGNDCILKGVAKGNATVNVSAYGGLIDFNLDVSVRAAAETANISYYLLAPDSEVDIRELGLSVFSDLSGNNIDFNIIEASFSEKEIEYEGRTFSVDGDGMYDLRILAADSVGNEIAVQDVHADIKTFDDEKEFYKESLNFAVASIVSSDLPYTIVEDDAAEDGKALSGSLDFTAAGRRTLNIDLGGVFRVSEVSYITITYKAACERDVWPRILMNGMTANADAVTSFNGRGSPDQYTTLTITSQQLLSKLSADDLLMSLTFADTNSAPRADDTYRVRLTIDSIQIMPAATKENLDELLLFDSEESLTLITGGRNVTIKEDAQAEGGRALEASFDNINSSGRRLTVGLGGIYRLSEIASVKVRFKIIYGDGNIWYRTGVNGTTTQINWYSMMKTATNGAQSNDNKVMEDYVTVVITQEYLKGGYDGTTPLENDALIQSLVFWDPSHRTDEAKYTTIRIADIEIVLNPTKETIGDTLKFNDENSLNLISGGRDVSIVEDADAEGGFALEASFDNINGSGRKLTVGLGGVYRLDEIACVKVSFKVVYGDGNIWYRVGVNGATTKIDWYNMMKTATGGAQSNENKVMEDYVTVEITRDYLKGGAESTPQLADDALIQSLVFWDTANMTDEAKYTTIRIANIDLVPA